MAIRKIARICDYGVFRDFTWPQDLPEFGRYNLIYGWNGTGKTTLSRLFRHLEKRQPPTKGKLSVTVGDREYSEEQFEMFPIPVRVFNRDFIDQTVFTKNGEVAPIYVIGERNVEKQKQADTLRNQRGDKNRELENARANQREAERKLDQFCIDRARVIKNTLRTSGSNPYNDYDKRRYKERAEKMVADGDAAAHLLNEGERDDLLAQHRDTPKPKVQQVAYTLPSLQQLADVVSDLLQETVVSATIQALKDDPDLAGWTRKGLGLHKDRNSKKCLFCEQPLPASRLEALEAHFSAEYEQFLGKLDEQIRQLQAASDQADRVELPDSAKLYADLVTEYDEAKSAVRKALERVHEFLAALIRALNDKKAKPFDRVALDVAVPPLEVDVIDRLNGVIRKHNQACDEFEARVARARERLALDMIAMDLDEFEQLRDAVRQAEADVKTVEQEVERLTTEIERLEREIAEHRQPAEDLNRNLCKYLGHGELQLAVRDTGYSISRNGQPATTLSEGEMTAISLLYFLKSLEDREFNLQNGVIVLDDPVSSLDQNSLFGAFGYIRAGTQTAAQVIILTHNFLFFQLVREWFRNLRGPDRRAWRVFMLECAFDGVARSAKLQPIDPLLMDFDSEYHYLFARLYRMATEPPATSLEAYYWAPSIARRLLETFLAFRVPDEGGRNRLWRQMQAIEFDEGKKSRIYRYMQTHSHRSAVGNPDEDLTLLGESRAVLSDVIEFMKAADADHVSRMIARITGSSENGTS
ncbi:MAG: hypothetical protein D6704_00520 [Nitrospirae bacterium]|nr:MAG: hypothetical protein D6704_00520 [Nitrospirota bacterium]